MHPTFPEPEQNHLNPVFEYATTRRSCDQSMLTVSSTLGHQTKIYDDRQRMSLDNGRPPHNAQVVSCQPEAYNQSPKAQGSGRALPMVTENTIERNDSTMSTTAIVTVPQVAKRYHASPIYIRKYPDRHRSLPTELPHVQSQSSLTEDLADWIMLPGMQSETSSSQEWDASSAVASSSMSVVSCPAVTEVTIQMESTPLGERDKMAEGSLATATTPTMKAEIFEPQQTNVWTTQETKSPTLLEPHQQSVANQERAASIRSTSSIITRKPLPPTARISPEIIVATIDKAMEPDEKIRNHPISLSLVTTSTHDANLLVLYEKMLSETSVTNEEAESQQKSPLNASTTTEATLPSLSSRPDIEDKIPIPSPPPIIPKPMSAQAKRRATHQRRMEIAFGGS